MPRKTKQEYFLYYKNLVEKKGGKLLSKQFESAKTNINFICDKNHNVWMTPSNIKTGYGCNQCSIIKTSNKQRNGIEKYIEIIEKRGGKCLSKIYTNNKTNINWVCKNGHNIWSNPYTLSKSKNGCTKCIGNKILTIEEMKMIAKNRGGECLSDVYINGTEKLKWKCSNGHTWKANAFHVKNTKTWCPKCNFNIREEICRFIFETMFKQKFYSIRPDWLKNIKTGRNLELDGYCSELKLAFEYDGEYHYQQIRNSCTEKVKILDEMTNKLCKDNGIVLIRIPYYTKNNDFQSYIIKQCEQFKINMPDKSNIDLNNLKFSCNKLNEMKEFAEKNNGKLISTLYPRNIRRRRKFCIMCDN